MNKKLWFLLIFICPLLTACHHETAAELSETTMQSATEEAVSTASSAMTIKVSPIHTEISEMTTAVTTSSDDSTTIIYSSDETTIASSATTTEISSFLDEHTTTITETIFTTTPERIPSDGELVRILDYIPDAVIDLRYATTNNFTGTVIYDDAEAYLCYGTVKKLSKVQDKLKEKGFCIIIWDAYRSEEAQYKLWNVWPDPTYVADPRNGITSHSRGNTIDLGIVYEDGSQVELPSGFDEFSLLADRDYSDVSDAAAENSRILEQIMNQYGFKGYWGEWWHYSDIDRYDLIIPEN